MKKTFFIIVCFIFLFSSSSYSSEYEFTQNISQKVHDANTLNSISILLEDWNIPYKSNLHNCISRKIFDELTHKEMRKQLSACLYSATQNINFKKDEQLEIVKFIKTSVCRNRYLNFSSVATISIINKCISE